MKGEVDLAVLGGALSATGVMLAAVIAFIDKLRKDAATSARTECDNIRLRNGKAIKVVGDEIDAAANANEDDAIRRLRRVQTALTE